MTRLLLIPAVTALAVTTGCISDTGHPAPAYAALSGQGDVTLAWSSEFNAVDDGIGVLVLLDFMVYDEEQGIPMENIRIEVFSNYGGAYVIDPADAMGSTSENASGIAWATLSAHMDYAGADVEALGDMNGDGVSEVAVGTAFINAADLTIYASGRIKTGGNLTTTFSVALRPNVSVAYISSARAGMAVNVPRVVARAV